MTRVVMFVLNDMRLDSRVRREAGSLGRAGYDVTVYGVMTPATAHLQRERAEGFTIVRVPMLMRPAAAGGAPSAGGARRPRSARGLMASVFVATRPLFGGAIHYLANWQLRWSSWARRVAAQVGPADVWHAHDFNTLGLATACARRFGGAVVYDSHELFTEAGANSALPRVLRAAMRNRERAWAKRASAVITVNDSIADVLRRQLGMAVTVVRNCAVATSADRSPLRARIGAAADEPVVMYHGSLTVGRGIERLIASLSDGCLHDAHLVIMGYGPLRPAVQAMAERSPHRHRIHLLPPVPPAEVTAWVAGADVAAMPIEPTTLNHRLSSPNKMFEAIAAGVPVVGPDFPEFRRVVLDAGFGPLGRLHADHAPATIAAEIHGLLSMGVAERAALRARCREATEQRWNWELEAGRLLNVYGSLARSGVPAPRRGAVRRVMALVAGE